MSDKYYTEVDEAVEGDFVDASAAGIDEHLTEDDLYGIKSIILDIETPIGACLEDLAANAKNGIVWQVAEHCKDKMKHIRKTQNRINATGKDLEGNLAKALLLGAEVLSQHSDAPVKLSVDVDGLVPNVFGNNGVHLWTIPASCGSQVVKESVFEPNNKFTRFMYEKEQKCDLQTLREQHIKMDVDPQKRFGLMDSQGVGWKVLTDNLMSPVFDDVRDHIIEQNKHILEGDPRIQHFAKIPYDVCSEIFEQIATPLKEIEKSYTDLYNIKAHFTRSDKQPWNSVSGLVKESAVFGQDSVGFEQEQKLSTPFSAGIKLKIKYILN